MAERAVTARFTGTNMSILRYKKAFSISPPSVLPLKPFEPVKLGQERDAVQPSPTGVGRCLLHQTLAIQLVLSR